MKKYIFKLIILLVVVSFYSCEEESDCETRKRCYSDGNGGQTCIDEPVPGTCFDSGFGF